MRLVTGYDDTGHSYAYNVDTFDKLKAYILKGVDEWSYNKSEELIERVKSCKTEEELMDDDLFDQYIDEGLFEGRDTFTTLEDPEE